jgi:hypothetical protein
VEVSQVFPSAMIEVYCPECADLKQFEQPPCAEGHGADCPEWMCLSCGTALLIGVPAEPATPLACHSRAA